MKTRILYFGLNGEGMTDIIGRDSFESFRDACKAILPDEEINKDIFDKLRVHLSEQGSFTLGVDVLLFIEELMSDIDTKELMALKIKQVEKEYHLNLLEE